MGKKIDYTKYDALGLAELVKNKEITALELCEIAISQIEKINPQVNAVIHTFYEKAKKDIEKINIDAVFAGVPFLLKDSLQAYKDEPLTNGTRALKNYKPNYDSEYVKRAKDAGLIILGKTNVPELCLLSYTEPELFGPSRNPWDLNRTSGGSSGGAAAAVASGMLPIAAASDGGGSIRIPASYCGLFGLKPSRGRNSLGPEMGEAWGGATAEHVLTRSVRDSAAFLDAVFGSASGDPFIITPPKKYYSKEILENPGKLKIAVSVKSVINSEVHLDAIKAVEHTVQLLESLGHEIYYSEPKIDGQALAMSYLMMYLGEVGSDLKTIKSLTGKLRKKDFETTTWTLGLLGRTYSACDFVHHKKEWNKIARSFGSFFQDYDLYLTPVTSSVAHKIGKAQPKQIEKTLMKFVNTFGLGKLLKSTGMVEQIALDSLSHVPFTQLANLAGLPAMSVPLYWNDARLPCGSHFTAAFGQEGLLFRIAAQLEKIQPWFDKTPSSWSVQ